MFQSLSTILPELFLAVTASLLLGFGLSKTQDRSVLVRNIAAGLLVIFGLMGFVLDRPAGTSFNCLLYTSPSPRDGLLSRMPSSA